VTLIALAAGFEWARLCRLAGAPAWGYALAIALVFLAVYNAQPWQPALLIAAAFWIVVVPAWLRRGVAAAHGAALAAAGFALIVPAALAMAALPPLQLLLLLVFVWIADSGAYFVGRALGKRKLAPSISPGKTWEGALGGSAAALLYAIICGLFVEGLSWVMYLAAALLLAVLSIVGDLFESAAKRQAAVKDSGTLLPGHGGVLDRIDSATAVLPVAMLLWAYVRGAA